MITETRVSTVRVGPIVGLIGQIVLLGILATTAGLGAAGWAVGVAYGCILCAALIRAHAFGPADWVTLTRATLVGCVTALVADSYRRPVPVVVLVTITIVALLLDALDGQVARRTGTASRFGARFDMEVDAFLILVLSVYVVHSVGVWVLAVGGMRYAFAAAGWVLPWLRGPVPPRYWRKVVAAIQGIVLVAATSGVLPSWLTVMALLVALVLLLESFGRDVVWLWHRHRVAVTERA